jgi:hypothetical protein
MPSLLSAPPSQGITAENSSQKRSSFAVSEQQCCLATVNDNRAADIPAAIYLMEVIAPRRQKIKVKLSPWQPCRRPFMAAISGGRANDERVKCLRIFADGSGETHMEDIDITLQPKKLFKDTPPLGLTENLPASWYNICYVPKDTGETDWHNPPQRLLVLWLTGEVEFETSDGNIRRLPAGSVVLAEDTTGKGHITRHPPEGQLVIHVALA